MSNPLNGLVGSKTLLESKQLLEQYREGQEPPGTTEAQVCPDTSYQNELNLTLM